MMKWWPALSCVSLVVAAAAWAVGGPADGGGAGGEAAAPAGVVARVASAMDAGDAAALRRAIVGQNADEALLVTPLSEAMAAVGRYGRAAVDAFGGAAAGTYAVAKPPPASPPAQSPAAAPDVAAGHAAVTPVAGGPAVTLVRRGGEWVPDFNGAVAVARLRGVDLSPPPDEPMRRYVEMAAALDAVTADVKAKRFATAAAAAAAAKRALDDARRGANAQ